ncbi:MAG: TonB family protein [Acidobacteriota bacterium]
MFDQTFVNTQAHARRPWTVAASLTLQTGLVALAVLLPMLHPEILRPKLEVPLYLPMRLKAQPVRPEPVPVQHAKAASPRPLFPTALTMPARIPAHVSMIADAPEVAGFAFAGAMSGSSAVIPGGLGILPEPAPPPPPPAPAVKPELPKGPLHVSTGVQSARLLFGPKPQYPQLARAARVQGTVRLTAVVAADGVIKNLRVISGAPLLIRAALEAVQQWRYQPTLLNGAAVEVITEIDVNFTLSQ